LKRLQKCDVRPAGKLDACQVCVTQDAYMQVGLAEVTVPQHRPRRQCTILITIPEGDRLIISEERAVGPAAVVPRLAALFLGHNRACVKDALVKERVARFNEDQLTTLQDGANKVVIISRVCTTFQARAVNLFLPDVKPRANHFHRLPSGAIRSSDKQPAVALITDECESGGSVRAGRAPVDLDLVEPLRERVLQEHIRFRPQQASHGLQGKGWLWRWRL